MKKEVSEKTLEINLCGEIISVLRTRWNTPAAFWMGMKQDQEFETGIDSLLKNSPGRHLLLQFKSPHASGTGTSFSISDRQNDCLLRAALVHPDSVYYVFPALNRFAQIRAVAPDLLSRTKFVRVIDLAWLSPTPSGRHSVTLRLQTNTALVRSDPREVPTRTWEEFVRTGRHGEALLPSRGVQAWRDEARLASNAADRGRIGHMLRGLYLLCVPSA